MSTFTDTTITGARLNDQGQWEIKAAADPAWYPCWEPLAQVAFRALEGTRTVTMVTGGDPEIVTSIEVSA